MKDEKHEKLVKILRLERKSGFQNESVMGGLENLSSELVESEEIRELLQGYSEKKPYARQEIVEEIEDLLNENRSSREDNELSLDQPVKEAAGIGKKRAENFEKLGVETIRDLLFHFPRRVEDRRTQKKISDVNHGDSCTIVGEVDGITQLNPRRNVQLVKAGIQDGTGTIYLVWFNQPWIKNQLRNENEIAVYGKAEREYGEMQMENPVWEPKEDKVKTRRLVPIYPGTEDLSQKVIRRVIRRNLKKYSPLVKQFPESDVADKYGFLTRREALHRIHQPEEKEDYGQGRASLAFSELFLFYTQLLRQKDDRSEETPEVRIEEGCLEKFRGNLPFKLTEDQDSVLETIKDELGSRDPMTRLLQGDVGTGKTVVAAGASYLAGTSGFQTAFMAPTTVLAEQHFRNLNKIFLDLPVEVDLLTGDTSKGSREEVLSRVRSGNTDILVGTHALLEESVEFNKLNLVIIDEEQRFGVTQKEKLGWSEGPVNKLVLSATPIPRTITATVYGQYEISKLEQFPRGEKDISTYWLSENKRDQVYEYVRDKLEEGSQAFIVLPLIEESEKQDLKSAVNTHEELQKKQLNGFKLGLLHGRMSQEEKGERLEKFEAGRFDALVSTTVIEVGVDIPQVNILIVEEADQFGLTQLHQLRGRIGRSGDKSYCFAIGSPSTDEGRERLEAFRDISDGFRLVEKDLEIRGPGDLLSSAQHGFRNSFRACNFLRDYDIMKQAKEEAKGFNDKGNPDSLEGLFEDYFAGGLDLLQSN